MSEVFNYCHVVGRTDVGRKRAANEDNMSNAITKNGLVAVVCDGMGGHVGGATASRIAVNCIIEHLNNVYYDDPRIAIGEAIDAANMAVIQEATEHPELTGMGSTCVLLLVRDGKVYIGHVGDSRIYLVRSKKIAQLTKDHSYVQMLVDCGEITKEQAEHHPRKNEITNALGIPSMTPATITDDAIIPEAGDCFVLCSDGLSGMISDDIINKVVSKQTEMNAQERVDRLVSLANENGGVDNITVQLVEFPVSPAIVFPKNGLPLWAKIGIPVFAALLLGAGSYYWIKHRGNNETERKEQSDVEDIKEPIRRDKIWLFDVPFKKNEKILELNYGENSLAFKHDGNVVYTEHTSFDQSSLVVNSPDIKVEYNNSLLSYTDKKPGDTFSFTISTVDKSEIYQYVIGVKDDVTKQGVTLPPTASSKQGGSSSSSTQNRKENGGQQANDEKPVLVRIDLTYDELSNNSRLLFNYFANPILKFNSQEKPIEYPVEEIIVNDLVFDNLHWEKRASGKQLIFRFKGDSSTAVHSFEIPFISKEGEKIVVLTIELKPSENTEIEGKEATEEHADYQRA